MRTRSTRSRACTWKLQAFIVSTPRVLPCHPPLHGIGRVWHAQRWPVLQAELLQPLRHSLQIWRHPRLQSRTQLCPSAGVGRLAKAQRSGVGSLQRGKRASALSAARHIGMLGRTTAQYQTRACTSRSPIYFDPRTASELYSPHSSSHLEVKPILALLAGRKVAVAAHVLVVHARRLLGAAGVDRALALLSAKDGVGWGEWGGRRMRATPPAAALLLL